VSAPDLSFLSNPLPVGDDPAMDTADAEFQAICDLANANKLAEAAARIEPLIARGVYDLRLVAILFVHAFANGGWVALERVLQAILALLGPNLAAFGPFDRRDAQLDRRLAWTFEKMSDLFAYHSGKNDATFVGWDEGATPEVFTRAIESGRALSALLGERSYIEAGQRFGAVSRMLAERAEVIRGVRARSNESSQAPVPAASGEAEPQPVAPTRASPVSNSGLRGRGTATLEVTDRFLDLEARLAAFSTLAERGDFERAAVAAEEVLAELADFDPRRYFPDVFAKFYRHMSRDVEKLTPYLNHTDSPRHEMLRQFFRIDLAKFVEEE
jgi:hypothetical protein